MKKLVLLSLTTFGLAGCAGLEQMQREANARLCTTDAAYEKGYNSGHDGEKMSSGFTSSCSDESRQKIVEAYRKGFQEGAQRASVDAPQRIVIGHDSRNRVLCTINVFGEKFEAWGENTKEANWKVTKLCAEKNNEVHCHNAYCQ